MTVDHYEILGIDRAASAEAIKQAWRKASSMAHPDKCGGDSGAQARINKAYQILSDAELRRRYDETGLDDTPNPVQERAKQAALELLAQAVDEAHADIVLFALDRLTETMERAHDEHRKLYARIRRLEGRRALVKTTDGDNLVHMLVDQQIGELRTRVAKVDEFLAIGEAARPLITRHQYVQPQQQQPVATAAGF